jgi:predicted transcriptional regulator
MQKAGFFCVLRNQTYIRNAINRRIVTSCESCTQEGVTLNKRSWPEIISDILEATLHPSNKTRVMYRSNLNFARFHHYFDDLMARGFVEELNGTDGRVRYRATERGRDLLKVLRTAQDLVFADEL